MSAPCLACSRAHTIEELRACMTRNDPSGTRYSSQWARIRKADEEKLALYTLRECGKGAVCYGLESVSAHNAILLRLAPEKPLASLEVGEFTFARRDGFTYEIVRVS